MVLHFRLIELKRNLKKRCEHMFNHRYWEKPIVAERFYSSQSHIFDSESEYILSDESFETSLNQLIFVQIDHW